MSGGASAAGADSDVEMMTPSERAQLKLMTLGDEYVETILVQWWKLIEVMDVTKCLKELEKAEVITASEKQELEAEDTRGQKVDLFLTMLLRKSMLDYVNMLKAVRSTQPPVAEILRTLVKRKPCKGDTELMSPERESKIRENLVELEKNLNVLKILPYLVPDVLDQHDAEELKVIKVAYKRANRLVDMLRIKPNSAYKKFLDALKRTHQSQLAELLDDKAAADADEGTVTVGCPVCRLRPPTAVSMNCGHTLCTECLEELLRGARAGGAATFQCPVCRADVVEAYRMRLSEF